MLSSGIGREFGSQDRQLFIDFTRPSSSSSKTGVTGSREKVADHVHTLTSNNNHVTFHRDVSKITENSFVLKVSYMGRSYSLNGVYRREQIRSFDQKDFSSTAIHIVHSNIFAFQSNRYVATFVSKKEYDALMESAHAILADSLC